MKKVNVDQLSLSVFLFFSFISVSCTRVASPPPSSTEADYPACTNDDTGNCVINETTKALLEPSLAAGNIASDVTIFGVVGVSLGPATGLDALTSTMNRSPVGIQPSILAESKITAGQSYTNEANGLRAVPDLLVDHDGGNGGSFVGVDRATWGSTSCGLSGATLTDRIKDCATKLGAEASWDGRRKGTPGAGLWRLVARAGAADPVSLRGREVWRDERTGLLWSSLLSGGSDGKTLNWCKAAGSHNIPGKPGAENDPNDHCDNAANQNTSGDAVSACYEAAGFTTVDVNIDSAGKASLGQDSVPAVAWRIPTLNDMIRADIDGLRFVMLETRLGGTPQEWTGTLNSANRSFAWTLNPFSGDNSRRERHLGFSVRCVGR